MEFLGCQNLLLYSFKYGLDLLSYRDLWEMAPIPEENSFFVSIFAEVILKKSSKKKQGEFLGLGLRTGYTPSKVF